MNSKSMRIRFASGTIEDQPLHEGVCSRVAATLAMGCLALSVCPMAAFAAPSGQEGFEGPQKEGNPPVMQQVPADIDRDAIDIQHESAGGKDGFAAQQGHAVEQLAAPTGQRASDDAQVSAKQQDLIDRQDPVGQQVPGEMQAQTDRQAPGGMQDPSGQQSLADQQAPSGQQPPADSQAPSDAMLPADAPEGFGLPAQDEGLDAQVRQILLEEYGIDSTCPAAGQEAGQEDPEPGQPLDVQDDTPEIPDGGINVQATIDSVHDVFRHYDAATLESADLSDETFLASLREYVKSAIDQRTRMFEEGSRLSGDSAAMDAAPAATPDSPFQAGEPFLTESVGDGERVASSPAAETAGSSLLQAVIGVVVGMLS